MAHTTVSGSSKRRRRRKIGLASRRLSRRKALVTLYAARIARNPPAHRSQLAAQRKSVPSIRYGKNTVPSEPILWGSRPFRAAHLPRFGGSGRRAASYPFLPLWFPD